MTRVFIAEKPSLGRAIADALPQPQRRRDGYIEAANGDLVTWCFGHLLEQVDPDVYDPKFKRWALTDLPIVPQAWLLAPRTAATKQIAIIGGLLKQATELVHAGDPDREGQLLVDELISYLKYPAAKCAGIRRLLVSDLNVAAVQRSLATMRLNTEFAALSISALSRSRADWLYGINMTRAYTLLGQHAGYKGVLSVGRVQTPVLGLVVRRDEEIAGFVSKPFYEVQAVIPHEGQPILALWKPSDACAPYQDDEGRVVHRALAENVCARIKGQPATATDAKHAKTEMHGPLPYSLSVLQIDAAKRYGLSAQKVLESAQELYEKYKVITYPRSDCRYLPAEHFGQADAVCRAISTNASELASFVDGVDTSLRSKAWNDKKVGAHHAIIPTQHIGAGALSGNEKKIYDLICRQYLMQFCQSALYAEGKLTFAIGTGTFIAAGKTLLRPGWQVLQTKAASAKKPAYVPIIATGTVLVCQKGTLLDKKTEAPKAFTDATLLQAMTGIARFVTDIELRKILKETDGLGTEATRASILEGLFMRQFLKREGKAIRATPIGRGLIRALPSMATYPDMTAHWERNLRDMAAAKYSQETFMAALEVTLAKMLEAPCRGEVPASLRKLEAPVRNGAKPRARRPPKAKRA